MILRQVNGVGNMNCYRVITIEVLPSLVFRHRVLQPTRMRLTYGSLIIRFHRTYLRQFLNANLLLVVCLYQCLLLVIEVEIGIYT